LNWFPADLALILLLLYAPVAMLTSLLVALFRWQAGRPAWSVCLMALGSFGVLCLWLTFDPGGLFSWMAD
jgi:hypothetical protein